MAKSRKRPTVADLDELIKAMDDGGYYRLVKAAVEAVRFGIQDTRLTLGQGDADNGKPLMSSLYYFERGRPGFRAFVCDLTTATMHTPGTLPRMLHQEARGRAKKDERRKRKPSESFADEYNLLKAAGVRPDKRIAERMTHAGKDKYRGDDGYNNFKQIKRRCHKAGLL